ncbi:MAG TPA: coenzyme F420-0:L-glutamate ligase [Propionibacteriaceae bacterium]
MISIWAPEGIGEVRAGTDLADLILTATAADPSGPLREGDIIVVTSKIVSKSEGRFVPAAEREDAISAESVRTLARRGRTRIVRTRAGLTLAAAGVDNSNVDPSQVVLLPADADASAARVLVELRGRTGLRLGVVVSDTAGRAWRLGQTDQAVGAAGVRVVRSYEGETDGYGNPLQVTAMAWADEIAAAADLVKAKLGGRPVAVLRGLAEAITDAGGTAQELVRAPAEDMFGFGSQEAVLVAALEVTGQADRYEDLVALDSSERAEALLAGCALEAPAADLVRRMLGLDLAKMNPPQTSR